MGVGVGVGCRGRATFVASLSFCHHFRCPFEIDVWCYGPPEGLLCFPQSVFSFQVVVGHVVVVVVVWVGVVVCFFNCYEYMPLFMVYSVWVVCFCYEAMEKVGALPLVGCRRSSVQGTFVAVAMP